MMDGREPIRGERGRLGELELGAARLQGGVRQALLLFDAIAGPGARGPAAARILRRQLRAAWSEVLAGRDLVERASSARADGQPELRALLVDADRVLLEITSIARRTRTRILRRGGPFASVDAIAAARSLLDALEPGSANTLEALLRAHGTPPA